MRLKILFLDIFEKSTLTWDQILIYLERKLTIIRNNKVLFQILGIILLHFFNFIIPK